MNNRHNQRGAVTEAVLVLVFVGVLMLGLVGLFGFRSVDAGTVGVVTNWGKVTGRTLEPGAHWITPIANGVQRYNTKKVIYETTTEQKQQGSEADYKDYPVDTNTSDGQQVDIFYTVRFSIDPTKATFIAQNIGSEEALVDKIVKTESRIWARNIPREFTAETLYTGDGVVEVQNAIEEQLRPTFEANGLILDDVGIREIKFTDEYVSAIEQKQIEAVKVDTAEQIAERAVHEKQARITQAEAEAEAQRLQRETLSNQVIQKELVDALKSGQIDLPDTLILGSGGSLSDFILNLPQ